MVASDADQSTGMIALPHPKLYYEAYNLKHNNGVRKNNSIVIVYSTAGCRLIVH